MEFPRAEGDPRPPNIWPIDFQGVNPEIGQAKLIDKGPTLFQLNAQTAI